MKTKKLPLAFWIFVGLVAGIAAGLILMAVPDGGQIAIGYIKPWGDIFLNLLKFIVVPIVLFSIAAFRIAAGPQLQGIQNVLPGGLDQAQLVPIGLD